MKATAPSTPSPPALRDGGDDVAAVAEGEDRELDAELVADRRAHGGDGTRDLTGRSSVGRPGRMPSAVPVPCVDVRARRRRLAAGLGRIRAELDVPRGVPARGRGGGRGRAPCRRSTPRRATTGATCRWSPSTRPGSRDLDQAFAIERRGRRRVAGLVRHRRRRRLRARRRAGRRRGPAAGRHAVPARRPGAAAPAGAVGGARRRCCRASTGRRCCGGSTSTATGALTSGRVRRALVRSRAQLDYPSAQAALDAGELADDDPLRCCGRSAPTCWPAEVARGGVSLPLPEQVVERGADGRLPADVADAAAGRGVERPAVAARAAGPPPTSCSRAASGCCARCRRSTTGGARALRRRAAALGVAWPDGPAPAAYPAFVRSPRPGDGRRAPRCCTRRPGRCGAPATSPSVPASAPAPEGDDAPPRRRRRAVRPRHRAAAPAGRPLRRRGGAGGVDPGRRRRRGCSTALAAAARPAWPPARQREGAVSRAVVDLAEARRARRPRRRRCSTPSSSASTPSGARTSSCSTRRCGPASAQPLELGAAVPVEVVGADPVARTVDCV